MAFLLELPPLAQIRLRNDYRKTKNHGDMRPVQGKTL